MSEPDPLDRTLASMTPAEVHAELERVRSEVTPEHLGAMAAALQKPVNRRTTAAKFRPLVEALQRHEQTYRRKVRNPASARKGGAALRNAQAFQRQRCIKFFEAERRLHPLGYPVKKLCKLAHAAMVKDPGGEPCQRRTLNRYIAEFLRAEVP
ncbi:MAG: hypothetical protein KGL43_19960 [Burkholderiales bacterium]|nr:hypothetical protein [Burkholderiales bacterium]